MCVKNYQTCAQKLPNMTTFEQNANVCSKITKNALENYSETQMCVQNYQTCVYKIVFILFMCTHCQTCTKIRKSRLRLRVLLSTIIFPILC